MAEDSSVNVHIKKKSVGAEDWFKHSLTLIPRCSLTIAEVIVKEYPTISALKEGNIEDLSNLKHGKCNRRIGKKLAEEIYKTVADA